MNDQDISSVALMINSQMIDILAGNEDRIDLANALSKADKTTDKLPHGLSARILEMLGLPEKNSHSIATLEYCGQTGQPEPVGCMRADPVHLIANPDNLVMSDPACIDLTRFEADSLVNEIHGRLAEDSWKLHALASTQWYLTTNESLEMQTYPVQEVSGRGIINYLPTGSSALRWQRLQIEIQAVLHTSETNTQRERAGKLPVNSLWFWGTGKSVTMNISGGNSGWHLWGNHPMLRGLEIINNIPRQPFPQDTASWIISQNAGSHLVVIDKSSGTTDLNSTINIIKSILLAVKSGRISQLHLVSDTGPVYTLSRKRYLRFWRQAKKLKSYFL